MTVVVVGAGIAGVACAVELAAAGVAVRVRERASRVGGRMGGVVVAGRPVDLGAAYFTVRDPGFARVVQGWQDAGLVRPWTRELAVLGAHGSRTGPDSGSEPGPHRRPDLRPESGPGPQRWAASGGLASPVTALAAGIPVELGHPVQRVTSGPDGPLVDDRPATAVVLAMPDPQARALLDPGHPAAARLAGRGWRPAIAVAAGWPVREWPALPAAFVNDHPLLTLLADDGDRRGDGAPVLVAHTTAALARTHAADPTGAIEPVLGAVRELLGVRSRPSWTLAHHWPHAAPDAGRDEPFHLGPDGVALAGDGWGSPRVETAWRSGHLLGRALAEQVCR